MYWLTSKLHISNHIIRLDKNNLLIVCGISLFMPVYMHVLHLLGEFHGHQTFMQRIYWFVYNFLMTFSIAFFVLLTNVYYLNYLEKHYPWRGKWKEHLCLEICGVLFYNALITVVVEVTFYPFRPSGGSFLLDLTKSLFYSQIFNFIIVAVYEGVYLFKQWKNALVIAEKLQKEHILCQFEMLRSQINPHFLFNCLNTLVGVVEKDTRQAVAFIKEFSKLYRSLLDYKDAPVVTLEEELKLVESYMFLQKIRFGDNLQVEINVNKNKNQFFLPPFSLQLLIENAIKHNVASSKKPLKVVIRDEGDYLIVKNNLQKRLNGENNSTKIGLKNLCTRYEIISDNIPEFTVTENEYIAKIPLIVDQYAPSYHY